VLGTVCALRLEEIKQHTKKQMQTAGFKTIRSMKAVKSFLISNLNKVIPAGNKPKYHQSTT